MASIQGRKTIIFLLFGSTYLQFAYLFLKMKKKSIDIALSGFTDIRSTMKTPDIFKYLSILGMNSGDR